LSLRRQNKEYMMGLKNIYKCSKKKNQSRSKIRDS
jgi:hypothetical protein